MPDVSRATRGVDLAPELARLTAPSRVSTSPPDRVAYARDLWPRGLLGVRAGDFAPHPPDVVVWPTTVAEVQAIVRLAAERRVPIVPFGAGSGVCGGTLPLAGGIVVDVKRMKKLLHIDERHLTARFEAGIIGEHLEHELSRRGYTLGHFPSSIMCSTLGGWLAARSAGQFSSRYGKIEDMARSVEMVTGTGDLVETGEPHALGPDITQLIIGSEGTLGIITAADLAIRPAPEVRRFGGFTFPRLASALEAMRRVMQRGLRPVVLRLYDELDTVMAMRASDETPGAAPDRHGSPGKHDDEEAGGLESWLRTLAGDRGASGLAELKRWAVGAALDNTALLNRLAHGLLPKIFGGCLLVAGVEGDRAIADAEWRAVERELEAAGGKNLGPGPGQRWLARRYAVSFKLSKAFAVGAFADTMEVATSWERLQDLYHAVREAVSPLAFIAAHFSHAYPEGCSIYFTFAAAVPGGSEARAAAERRYDAIWRAGQAATNKVGATISHHHGVGLLKSPFMESEHGTAMELLRACKAAFDPHQIFNPGKLGLDGFTP